MKKPLKKAVHRQSLKRIGVLYMTFSGGDKRCRLNNDCTRLQDTFKIYFFLFFFFLDVLGSLATLGGLLSYLLCALFTKAGDVGGKSGKKLSTKKNLDHDMLYGLEDIPPWYLIVFLGFQVRYTCVFLFFQSTDLINRDTKEPRRHKEYICCMLLILLYNMADR